MLKRWHLGPFKLVVRNLFDTRQVTRRYIRFIVYRKGELYKVWEYKFRNSI